MTFRHSKNVKNVRGAPRECVGERLSVFSYKCFRQTTVGVKNILFCSIILDKPTLLNAFSFFMQCYCRSGGTILQEPLIWEKVTMHYKYKDQKYKIWKIHLKPNKQNNGIVCFSSVKPPQDGGQTKPKKHCF